MYILHDNKHESIYIAFKEGEYGFLVTISSANVLYFVLLFLGYLRKREILFIAVMDCHIFPYWLSVSFHFCSMVT